MWGFGNFDGRLIVVSVMACFLASRADCFQVYKPDPTSATRSVCPDSAWQCLMSIQWRAAAGIYTLSLPP